ncbi:hypothetical protein, partial [Pseudomonas sp. NPDC089547]|uniref:hypothetical protein n=1 Tax=Pseudomonas sp. NPDC089547 TaxID=3390652 RepID=UPI003CFBCFD9
MPYLDIAGAALRPFRDARPLPQGSHELQDVPIKKGSSRNPGKDRNKNAGLMDDVRASKHINKP